MDVCFDVLIPRISLPKLTNFKEQMVSWGGEYLAQDPPRFSWRSLAFTKRPMPNHIVRLMPPDFSISDMDFFSLDGDGIQQWEERANSDFVGADEKILLRDFLGEILPELDKYAIVFEIDCDRVDDVVRLDSQKVIERINSELHWTSESKGFIGWFQ